MIIWTSLGGGGSETLNICAVCNLKYAFLFRYVKHYRNPS